MALHLIQNAFSAGEISPELFGRTDLAKWKQGCSTLRNFFCSYKGGAISRPGLAYVGTCKQPGTSVPPRDIPFQFSLNQGYALEFGELYMRIKSMGAYVTEATNAITGISQANPGVFSYTNTNYTLSNGDWVFVANVGGMTNFNGLTWIVTSASSSTFTVTDLFGNPVNTTLFNAYTSGGTLARIYTVASPYHAVDLPYLKFTQSADTMTLTCVNTATSTEYPPYDLVRNGATNWVFTAESFGTSINPPSTIASVAANSTTINTWYGYVVTAVDAATGEESIASVPTYVQNNDISINAGSNTITWGPVTGAGSYNVYAAVPSYSTGGTNTVPIGAPYGYIGTAVGAQFTDTNITPDFTVTPPTHQNPFGRGEIIDVVVTGNGSGYTQGTIGYTITTATGSGFVGVPIAVNGTFGAFLIQNPGVNYQPGDTITITGGTGGTATLTIGPESGTYPGVCGYFQERRVYADTLNNPDTLYMSQPGAFLNFDTSLPTVDDDAITATPWSQQVNGVQFVVMMPSGLVVLTGRGAWQITGGTSAAVTPADIDATPQAYNGCNATVPPIVVNYDIIYVQSKGSIVRDLSYNFFVNIYTGTDMTVLSSHLFNNHQIEQWAYAEEPFKTVWAIREDGIMLCLTYLKEQDVYGWSRHDTNGLFVSVCSITEPPIDAVYVITKRYIQGHQQWMYYSERMDNRAWSDVTAAFCVDSGLRWPVTFPNATLTPDAVNGTSNISSVNVIFGGKNYSANPVIAANDPTDRGSGATFSATVVGGVIIGINVLTQGSLYSVGGWNLTITDPTGSGAIAQPIVTNNVTFTASANVFSSANVGNVIRFGPINTPTTSGTAVSGGGVAVVTSYVNPTTVVANITVPLTIVVPDDPFNTPIPALANTWSIAVPTMSVSGLNHIEGMQVAILADGSVVPNQTVTNGTVTLPAAYTAIAIGLPYTCQLQTLYLDPPGPTTAQTRRKNISSIGLRVTQERGLMIGSNQPDQSTQPDNAAPPWTGLTPLKERSPNLPAGDPIPLFTGDEFGNIQADWDTRGQLAFQQTFPLPCQLLACVSYYLVGDTASG